MSEKYILDADGNPVLCEDLKRWGQWMEDANKDDARRVAYDKIGDDVRVSTVFLGLDHSWNGPPPVLWETMIFGGEHSDYQERYTSREAALKGHARAVAKARGGK